MIGIIGAMIEEVALLKENIENPVENEVSGIRFISGKICGKDVVCAVCGIGKVNAALCAQAMILTYHPDCVINTGVGGAIDPSYKLLDVIMGERAVQHDVDTTGLGDEIGFVSTVNKVFFPLDENLTRKLQAALTDMGIPNRRGVIATGDQFINSAERKEWIQKTFGGTVCEMEGGSIAHTCYICGVPCAIMRSISDAAEEDAFMSYNEFKKIASDRSAEAIIRYIKEYAD